MSHQPRHRPPSAAPGATVAPDAEAPAAALLAAASGSGEALPAAVQDVVARDQPTLLAVIAALGRQPNVAAAKALQALEEAPGISKEARKAARRELHRLRSAGIRLEAPAVVVRVTAPPTPAQVVEAWATPYDGSGSRALWLFIEHPWRGGALLALVLNDQKGIIAVDSGGVNRRRFRQLLEQARADTPDQPWVPLPPDYARFLVHEALALNSFSGTPVPAGLEPFREALRPPEQPYERALVYEQISPLEARFDPRALVESPALFERPEVRSWFFPPSQVAPYLDELEQLRSSRVLLPGVSREEREVGIFRRAVQELFTPQVRHALKRRLEETAYILAYQQQLVDARRALAAALSLQDEAAAPPPTSSLLLPFSQAASITSNPFATALVGRSLERAAVLRAKPPTEGEVASETLWLPGEETGLDEVEPWLPE